ncbi:MAG: nicotinate (nicotinamide) nucleotide adenylyltransferase [Flavobacteriales bacterium]|nr:nicotinate (nicotinamide) nucleotide adenylyltransferase [Flavobacteriales bacterium]
MGKNPKPPPRTGLLFGSFNPVHIGHLALAAYFLGENYVDEVWFVVSPQNPHKRRETLLPFHHRVELLRRAVGDDSRLRVSEVERHMPLPSYTVQTMRLLLDRYPHHPFFLIMGSDNALGFPKWKECAWLARNCHFLVYPRLKEGRVQDALPAKDPLYENFVFAKAPVIEITATLIRHWVGQGRSVRHLMPEAAWRYLDEMNFYKTPPRLLKSSLK